MLSLKNNIIILIFFIIILISVSSKLLNTRLDEQEEGSKEKDIFISPPKFSRISGFYPDNFKLKLSSDINTKIYYTLDSTDPRTSPTSMEFKDYILIYDRSLEPNIYSSIGSNESSPVSITAFRQYTGPNFPIDKAMIVRAVVKNSNGDFSDIITKTYFVTTGDLYKYQDLTVISIVTDPENLFAPDKGIYVTGNMYQEAKKNEDDDKRNRWRMKDCNFLMKGKEWEREVEVIIFDKGEIKLQQKMGIRIKGAFSRNLPGKSFNIYAREKYGKSTIELDLLKDNYDINGNLITSYKSLSLRNIYEEERLRDEFGRDLFYFREGLTSTNMRNSILFLDGEYWGFYVIQEKIGDVFISQNYLIPSNKVSLIKNNKLEDGPPEELDNFNYFCGNYSSKNVSDEKVYMEINNYIDLYSFIETFATEIYISNLDWPGNNDGQWKYIGSPIEENKYTDGKWRFLIFDLDYTMGTKFMRVDSENTNSFILVEKRNRRAPVNLFLNLLNNNTDFQNKFVNIICDYANDVYENEKVIELIEKYKEECTDMVVNSELRWSGQNYKFPIEGYSYYKNKYLKALDSIFDFFQKRPSIISQHMKEYLRLKGDLVDLNLEIHGRGKIQINTITPKFVNGNWSGKYFSRIPIAIKAIPDFGYKFKEWTGYIQSNKREDEITLLDSQKIIAIFD